MSEQVKKKILYIQTAFLGDLLLSIPTLKYLRKNNPDYEIHLICRKGLGAFFTRVGLVDLVFEGHKKTKPTPSEAKFFLSNHMYEAVYCPHESFRSFLFAKSARSRTKIGFKRWWNIFTFHHRVERPMQYPEALRQMSLLVPMSSEMSQSFTTLDQGDTHQPPMKNIPAWSSMALDFFNTEKRDFKKTREHFSLPEGPFVVLSPGSVWPTKRWGVKKYTELAIELVSKGMRVVLVGAPSEKTTSREIFEACPSVIDLTGVTNIFELGEVLSLAAYVVANDSGTMHMASVVGTPCVAIFGPTVQRYGYQPWSPVATVLENNELKCRPCSSHGTKSCPIGTHECMTEISVQSVLKQVLADVGH